METDILESQNLEHGFWGTTKLDYEEDETQKRWNIAFETLALISGKPSEEIREFLDSIMGRHIADSELMNILVWNKMVGGQGQFYRSQHELIPIFKKKGKHQNHINMGKYGRYRTNVIDCPGIRATNPSSLELLKLHPTVKPTALGHSFLEDSSSKNDIVLDCFGGSGSTLLAAERCKRRARIIEIDPRYCDVIIWRWQKETGKTAKLIKNYSTDNNEANTVLNIEGDSDGR